MTKRDDYALRVDAESGWKNDPKIRQEFESMEQYFAFLKANENGLVKMLGGKL